MATDCTRSIAFTIPGTGKSPGIKVTATEVNGMLVFTADVVSKSQQTADLRALFFNLNDDSKLAGLTFSGKQVNGSDTVDVIDLGNGANMQGAASPFDAGVRFGTPGISKDNIHSTSFTLSNTDNNLTLDDIANVQFGARTTSVGGKLVVTAPAAPNAVNDAYGIYEDGQAGLTSPSHNPAGTIFQVLDNDTDADGNTLTITAVHDQQHGSVQIVDGNDLDSLVGDAILYTPNADYSGSDSFEYCISDNNGGTDFAKVDVTVAAVADVPALSYEILAGDEVNQIIVRVTADQTDTDSSEFIDRIELSGIPEGVTVDVNGINPGDELDQIVQNFLITLPIDADINFDLGITAVAKETSNDDEEMASATIPIVYESNSSTKPFQFSAENQSIWDTGAQFTFTDDRFLGLDTGPFSKSLGSELYAGINGDIKLGFQSTLSFEGGEIDATSNYDVTVNTNFNKTVDQLLISTSSLFTGASFSTEGPEGTYLLDFIYDLYLQAYAGVNIDFGSIDFDPLGIIPGDQTLDLGGINEQLDFPAVDIGPGSLNVLDLNSDTLAGTIDLPPPLDAFSVNYDWPDITTTGGSNTRTITASGSSSNFVELNIDMDELVTQLLGLPINPLHPVQLEAGPFYADVDLLDVDVIGGLNFFQDFEMKMGDQLSGLLLFEDGSNKSFTIGDDWLINDASLIDEGGNNNGFVDFSFTLIPTATLNNNTDLGFNIGANLDVFSVALGYDIEIYNPFGDNLNYSDSIGLGPLASFGDSAPVGQIGVYDNTFALNFAQQQASFMA